MMLGLTRAAAHAAALRSRPSLQGRRGLVLGREERPDWYRVLGLERGASQAEVRQAYLRACRESHPDVSKLAPDDASAAFKRVQQAYSVLGSAAERAAYDIEAGGRGSALDAAAAGRPATSHGPFAPLNSLEQWLSHSFRWLLLALAPFGLLILVGLSTLKYEDPTRFDPDDETWVRAGRAVESGRWVRFGRGAGLDSIGPNQQLHMVPRSWIGTLLPVEDLAPLRRRAASRRKSAAAARSAAAAGSAAPAGPAPAAPAAAAAARSVEPAGPAPAAPAAT